MSSPADGPTTPAPRIRPLRSAIDLGEPVGLAGCAGAVVLGEGGADDAVAVLELLVGRRLAQPDLGELGVGVDRPRRRRRRRTRRSRRARCGRRGAPVARTHGPTGAGCLADGMNPAVGGLEVPAQLQWSGSLLVAADAGLLEVELIDCRDTGAKQQEMAGVDRLFRFGLGFVDLQGDTGAARVDARSASHSRGRRCPPRVAGAAKRRAARDRCPGRTAPARAPSRREPSRRWDWASSRASSVATDDDEVARAGGCSRRSFRR